VNISNCFFHFFYKGQCLMGSDLVCFWSAQKPVYAGLSFWDSLHNPAGY
jgi:hypothetical protein